MWSHESLAARKYAREAKGIALSEWLKLSPARRQELENWAMAEEGAEYFRAEVQKNAITEVRA